MKTKILILWICIVPFTSNSQTWSEPITIYAGGYNDTPDFTIDKNGIIHCVWAHKIQTNFYKIFYSKSTDDGYTWSIEQDISQNNSLWMIDPQIVTDTNNLIYITYDCNAGDPNKMHILYKKFVLFFFRFGICPACVTMSLGYNVRKAWRKLKV